MRFVIALTDKDWFEQLSALQPDEVNFWRPGGQVGFEALQPGEPFLFKLHSPNNYIVGGGFFSHFTKLPVSIAWDAFREKNGVASLTEMRERIWRYKTVKRNPNEDFVIGCITLQSPFFFHRQDWLPLKDWPRQVVSYKQFDDNDPTSSRLWQEVRMRMPTLDLDPAIVYANQNRRSDRPQFVFPRLGQGTFRALVTDAYRRTCAVSGSHILPVLDAAHIRPHAKNGPLVPANGILLRQDVHTLFDRGYISVMPDLRIEVSKKIKEDFDNGKEYYAFHGGQISTPERAELRPSADFLRWHNDSVYLG